MNRLQGTIQAISTVDRLTLIDVTVGGDRITGMIIDTPETNPNLRKGQEVWVVFKESDVALGHVAADQISISNRLSAKVNNIERGKLLSRVVLDYQDQVIHAIIPNRSLDHLKVEVDKSIDLLLRINEILLLNKASNEE